MDISILKKVVLGVQITAFAGQLVALAAPFWLNAGGNIHIGLWQYCSHIAASKTSLPQWYLAVRGLETLGFCLAFVTTILTGVYLYKSHQTEPQKTMCFVDMLICFTTGLSIIVGVGIYGGKVDEIMTIIGTKTSGMKLTWAFGISAGSAALSFLSGILMVILLVKT